MNWTLLYAFNLLTVEFWINFSTDLKEVNHLTELELSEYVGIKKILNKQSCLMNYLNDEHFILPTYIQRN